MLSTITKVAGGAIRDVPLEKFPRNTLVNPLYLIPKTGTRTLFFRLPIIKDASEFTF
jgi:uncharacterized membrane protein YeiH